jgi:hypothetical protein
MKEFSADSHDYYMIGFYVDKNSKPGWHAISVRLDAKAELRYRNGFEYSNFDPEKVRLTDLQLAMMSPLPYTSVPFSGRFSDVQPTSPKRLVHFELALPPDALSLGEANDLLNFDILAVARGIDGREVAKQAQRITRKLQSPQAAVIRSEGVRYMNKIELPPGKYGVWVIVRDNVSGRTGSITTSLVVN